MTQMDNPKHRIASLDGLRAVSISLVLLSHTLMKLQVRPSLMRFSRYGTLGVDVFFVISGFLITTLLLKESGKTGTISLRNFYVRRAYRILPASYAATLLIALVWHARVNLRDVLCAVLYVQNFNPHPSWSLGHMWSLSIEEQFYLLWPFLLKRFYHHRYKIVILAMVIAPLFRASSGFLGLYQAEGNWFPSWMDALATGCLLALFRERAEAFSASTDRWFIPVLIGTLMIPQFTYPPGVEPLLMVTLQNLGIAFCVEHCIRKRYWLLNWAPVVWVGVLSYSIYLFQQPFFQTHPSNLFETFPVNLACILLAAMACHYLIERPFLRLREVRDTKPKQIPVNTEA